jgi:hypothetical protein
MEAVALLHRARQAGLVVRRDGDRVIVRGPKRLQHLATQLLDDKAAVLLALEVESDPALPAVLDGPEVAVPVPANFLRVQRHVHFCTRCARQFRCTAPSCAEQPKRCVCCTLDVIEGRGRR